MNKTWIIAGLVIAAIAAYLLYASGTAPVDEQPGGESQGDNMPPQENGQSGDQEVNFIQTGNLVRNNPGMKPGVWYLIYEEPGAAALNKELAFDDNSVCDIAGQDNNCAGINPEQGKRVRVQGIETDNVVRVRRMSEPENGSQASTRNIKLYYYNPNLDKDASGNVLCSRKGLVAVDRQIPVTETPIQDAINSLIQGKLTDQEKQQGIATEFPLPGFSLQGAALNNGVLTLEFEDAENRSSGGSCRAGILWYQIEATAKQFPEVKQVKFMPETLFQP